jgi:hypothetical protein
MFSRYCGIAFAFLMSCTILSSAVAQEKATPWRFAVLADSRSDTGFGDANYAPNNGVNRSALSKLVMQMNNEKLDFVLFVGDAIMGEKKGTFAADAPGSVKSEMTGWLNIMKKLKCPWYFSVGNHEVYHPGNDQTLRDVFTASGHAMPTNGPADQQQLVYSFDNKNAHIVCLSAYQPGSPHHVQTDWLKKDLESVKKDHIFVMCHEPAFSIIGESNKCLESSPADRDAFWNIMNEKRVDAYLCAHEHVYYRNHPVPQSDVWQIICGLAGAPQDAVPNSKEKQKSGYLLVEINGQHVTYKMKDISGKVLDTF